MATTQTPFSLISHRKLLALYAALLRCRTLAELAGASGENVAGYEAPFVAVGIDLKTGDTVATAAADFLPALVERAAPKAVLKAMRGKASQPPFAAMIADTLAAARIHAQRKNRRIAAIFARGSSVSSAAWRNALRAAGAERLPILFVSQPGAEQARGKNAGRLSFAAIRVDAHDAVAIYRVASEAQTHARRGNGPTLIECVSWPLAIPQDGATAVNDPIVNMERYLAQTGIPFAGVKKKAIASMRQNARIGRAKKTRERTKLSAGQ